jgi:hypothetical protein
MLKQGFSNTDVPFSRRSVQGSSAVGIYGRYTNSAEFMMAHEHTDSVDICTALKEGFHNTDVAFNRSHV